MRKARFTEEQMVAVCAIFTPALVAALMAFVRSCCLKIDGTRLIVLKVLV
jgi:hypothetical protein